MDINDACFVFGLALDGKGAASEITFDTPETNNWIHIDYSTGTASAFLQSLGVSPLIIDSLIRLDTRPRTMVSSHGTLLVLRGINLNPGADPEDMVSLRLWIEPGRLISVRQRRLLSVQEVKQDLLDGHGPTDIMSVVIAVLGRIADKVGVYVNDVDDRVSELEEHLHEKVPDARDRINLSSLRREIASVRRYIAPQREALESMYTQSRNALDDRQLHALREQVDRMLRYLEDLDLLRERTTVLQEELANMIAEMQNNRMYALSIVAAIFLPVTFVTGLFGMNVAGLPGVEEPFAFLYVAGSMIGVTALVMGFFRLNRWL